MDQFKQTITWARCTLLIKNTMKVINWFHEHECARWRRPCWARAFVVYFKRLFCDYFNTPPVYFTCTFRHSDWLQFFVNNRDAEAAEIRWHLPLGARCQKKTKRSPYDTVDVFLSYRHFRYPVSLRTDSTLPLTHEFPSILTRSYFFSFRVLQLAMNIGVRVQSSTVFVFFALWRLCSHSGGIRPLADVRKCSLSVFGAILRRSM